MNHLATQCTALGRHDEALKLSEEVWSLHKAKYGPAHEATLTSLIYLEARYSKLGRTAEALKLHEELYALRKAKFGADATVTLQTLARLADDYARTGRRAEALPLRQELLSLRTSRLGPDHADTLKALSHVAQDLVALGRGSEALLLIDDGIPRAQRAGTDKPLLLELLISRRRHFEQAGDSRGCRETAEMWEALGRTDKYGLYAAAKVRAATAAVIRAGAASESGDSTALADANLEADRAMDWLEQAVAAGFNSTALMKFDGKDLKALADREDFQKLVSELEKTEDRRQTTARDP
jgi:hypothetical protein